MKEFTPTGACRMCVVEVEGRDRLVTACSQPVEEWMKIRTHSPRVITARKTIVELLLSNHPDDCLYCDKNLNCELQRLSEELNIREDPCQEDKTKARPVQSCNCKGIIKMHPLRKMRQGMRGGDHSNFA
jgi:NADH dehydrogenase/NADH:ubiquinone oxidoreductase subunit G